MIKGCISLAKSNAVRAPRGEWKLVRCFFLMLMAAVCSFQRLAPSRFRTGALRALARHTGTLEHALRCLLLLMRAAPAPATSVPESLSRNAASRHTRHKPPRFSLSLAKLAQGFARRGLDAPALTALRKARAARNAPPPRGPTASAPVADPAEILRARLDAMRAVFADPHLHAAKLAALLRASGLSLRARKTLIPVAALWTLAHHHAQGHSHALHAPIPNTS